MTNQNSRTLLSLSVASFSAKLLSTTALTAASLATLVMSANAQSIPDNALPQGEVVTHGSATYDRATQNTLKITQHSGVVSADYFGGFNIGKNAAVLITQKSSDKFVHIDKSDKVSIINGLFSGNGTNFILNRDGVLIGESAVIDMGGFVAATGELGAGTDLDAGKIEISNFGKGAIDVKGGASISVAEAGIAAFVSPTIRNDGVINARLGKVAFAAGDKVTLDLYGDKLVEIAVSDKLADAIIEHTGTINAEGGTVQMTASAAKEAVDNIINVKGLVTVASVTQKGGKIILSGGSQGTVNVEGTLDASGEDAGSINVTGENINIAESASLKADGVINGNGGEVIVFADNKAVIEGEISANSGVASGNGGFIETSAYNELSVTEKASVTAAAYNGLAGTWLLDPLSIVIGSGSGSTIVYGGLEYALVNASTLSKSLTDGTNVKVQTGINSAVGGGKFIALDSNEGDILVVADIVNSGSKNSTLTLNADDDIRMLEGADITASSTGKLSVVFEADDDISTDPNSTITTKGGTVTFNAGGDIELDDDITTAGGAATFKANGTFSVDDSDDVINTAGGTITVISDAFGLGGQLNAGSAGKIVLGRDSDGQIDVGDSNGSFYLISQDELNRMTAKTLEIGIAGGGADNNIRVEDADLDAFNTVVLSTKTPSNGADESVRFTGVNSVNNLTVNADDSITFDDNSKLSSIGDLTFNANLNKSTSGVFSLGKNALIDSNGKNITINTFGSNMLGVQTAFGSKIDAEGGNIVINNSGYFLGTANSLITKGTGTIDVNQWFGVSIQNVVSALNNTGTGLNTIDIGAGTYTENLTLDQANLKLNGATGTKVQASGSGNLVTVTANNVNIDPITFDGLGLADYGINANGVSGLIVDGNTFQNFLEAGVSATNTTNAMIKGNTFNNTGTYGVLVNGGTGTTIEGGSIANTKSDSIRVLNAANTTIQNISLSNAGTVDGVNGVGSGIVFVGATGAKVDNAKISNIARIGIYAGSSSDITLVNNTITNVGSGTNTTAGDSVGEFSGIHIEGTKNLDVSGNTISGATKDGINLGGLVNVPFGGAVTGTVKVDGNVVNTTGEDGIDVTGGSGVLISGNFVGFADAKTAGVVDNINGDGIRVSNSDNAVIKSNKVTQTNSTAFDIGSGIHVLGGTGVTVGGALLADGNTLTDIEWDGVKLTGGSTVTVQNNSLTNVDRVGIYAGNVNGALITQNVLVNGNTALADYGVISSDGGSNLTVTKNDIDGSVGHGIRLSGATGKNLISDNDIDGVAFDGIQSLSLFDVTISKNRVGVVDSANRDGIYATGGSGTLLIGGSLVDANIVTGSGDDGIDVENTGSVDVDITFNTIDNNNVAAVADANGIEVSGVTNGYVYKNDVKDAGWDGINVQSSKGTIIEANTIADTKGASGIGLFNGVSDTTILNNTITNSQRYGMWIGGHAGTLSVSGNTVTGVTTEDGIYLNNSNGTMSIAGNFIDSIGRDAISISNSDGVLGNNLVISGNLVGYGANKLLGTDDTTIARDGIRVEGSDYTTVQSNKITKAADDGIEIIGSSNIVVGGSKLGNLVTLSGHDGITTEGGDSVQISYNTVTDTLGASGIAVHTTSNSKVNNNTITDTALLGVYGQGSNGIQVLDNTITRSGKAVAGGDKYGHGIGVESADGVTITGNTVDTTNASGISVGVTINNGSAASKNVTVDNNKITNVYGDGIIVDGGAVSVSGNTISFTGNDGIDVRNSENVSVSKNKVGYDLAGVVLGYANVGANGIFIVDSKSADVLNNQVSGSEENGIYVDPSPFSKINYNDVSDFGSSSTFSGILLEEGDDSQILGNIVTGASASGQSGIKVTGSNRVQIGQGSGGGLDSNVISKVGTGINLVGGGDLTVDNNNVSEAVTGVSVTSVQNKLNILENVLNTTGHGIAFTDAVTKGDIVDIHDNKIVAGSNGINFASDITDATVRIGDGSGATLASDPSNFIDGLNGINFGGSVKGSSSITIDGNRIGYRDGLVENAVADDGIVFNKSVEGKSKITIVDNFISAEQQGVQFNGTISGTDTTIVIGRVNDGNTIKAKQDGIEFDKDISGQSFITVSYNTVDADGNGLVFRGETSNADTTAPFSNSEILVSNNDIEGGLNGVVFFNDARNVRHDIMIRDNVNIKGSKGDGILFEDDIEAAVLRIQNNGPIFGSRDGIHIEGSFTNDAMIIISGNKNIDSGSEDGIDVNDTGLTDGATLEISGNAINLTGDNGIEVRNFDSASLSKNIINNANGDGIEVSNSANISIVDNKVYNSGDDGIDVEYSEYSTVKGNIVSGTDENGIEVENSDYALVDANTIDSSGENGIYMTGSGTSKITSNTISDALVDGIQVNNSYGGLYAVLSKMLPIEGFGDYAILIDSNVIDNTGDDGIEVINSGRTRISDNTITNAGLYSVESETKGFVSKEYYDGYGADGIHVRNVFSDDGFYDMKETFIDSPEIVREIVEVPFVQNWSVEIVGNAVGFLGSKKEPFVPGAVDDGIQVLGSGNTLIENNTIAHIGVGGIEEVISYDGDVDQWGSDGIHVDGAYLFKGRKEVFFDGFDVPAFAGPVEEFFAPEVTVNIIGNTVDITEDDGIQADHISDLLVESNDVSQAGDNGIEVSYSDTAEIMTNTVDGSGSNGIYLNASDSFLIAGNTSNLNLGDGILINGSNDGFVNSNTVLNNLVGLRLVGVDNVGVIGNGFGFNTDYGVLAQSGKAGENGVIKFMSNTINASPVGARFESGSIDISDLNAPNIFVGTGGTVGMQFDETGVPGSLNLVGNTIGATIFSGFLPVGSFYARFEDGALLDAVTGNPTIIDGVNANFDGLIPAAQGGFVTPAQLAFLEARIFDADDAFLNGRGQLFVGAVPTADDLGLENLEDFFNRFGTPDNAGAGLSVTVRGLPNVTAAGLNALTPAAGEAGPAGLAGIEPAAGEETSAVAPQDIEPEAGGGESVSCWSDAVAGGVTSFNFGGTIEDSLAGAGNCNSGDI